MSAVILPYSRRQLQPLASTVVERRHGRSPFRLWVERAAARRALNDLHPEQLRETGLDPEAVLAEAVKPFWRA